MNCVFCRIAAGASPADIVYQDDMVTAFRDINPQAPIHILIIPNTHLASIADIKEEHDGLIGRLFGIANQLAIQEGVSETGYRLVVNRGDHGGQTVYHLHLHLLGGRWMKWPPG